MKILHYHLVGIGGIGMSGIARLLMSRGLKVSGSDLKESKIISELKTMGASIFIGHNPLHIKGADIIVYSSAIRKDNPEIQEAKRQSIPVIKRAEALADLMKEKTVITVTGSHGKTTTASLVSCLLMEAGLLPTVVIGGILRNIDTNAKFGESNFFVAEADESDGSFLNYGSNYSIVTNIDYEHLDYYKEFKNIVRIFGEFIDKTESQGCIFACYDDISLRNLLKDYKKSRYVLFGLSNKADIYAKNIEIRGLTSSFDCLFKNKFLDRFHLALGGRHNISNALSVIALGITLNIDLKIIKKTLIDYKGTQRRLEIKFNNKYIVVDDYAHHPTEIKATLAAVRSLASKRVIAIFQPHRYTRTKLLLDEFGRSFDLADYIIITDIYPAGEAPIQGVSGKCIYEKIKEYNLQNKEVYFLSKEEIPTHILEIIKPDDVIITLGAGDIVKTSDELVERLKG